MVAKKKILKTVFLPEIFPRVKGLLNDSFSNIAYLLCLVFNMVRILPNNHIYLQKEHIGQYGIIKALSATSHHIKISKNNIDQIFIFFAILSGLFLFIMQIISAGFALFISTANAQATIPTSVEGFFTAPNPEQDLGFRLMDLVFGIPGIFNLAEGESTALQQALQSMFEFYSLGMVAVGAIIIVYFVITLVAETARTGIPFGQRSNKAWMAPRVILFFGLLIPIAYGINGGQYITLYTAKLGSLLASSGWTLFHEKIAEETGTLAGTREQTVAIPKSSDISNIPSFMLIAKTCQKAYEVIWNEEDFAQGISAISTQWQSDSLKAWVVYKTPPTGSGQPPTTRPCNGSQTAGYTTDELSGQSYQDITACSQNDFNIVFGVKDPEKFINYQGGILPVCGSLSMKTTDLSQPGSAIIQNGYFDLIRQSWNGFRDINKYAEAWVRKIVNVDPDPSQATPNKEYIKQWQEYLDEYTGELIQEAVQEQIENGEWEVPEQIRDYGWVGAGIWYNKIAEQNGALVSSIHSVPSVSLYPKVQEETKANNKATNQSTDKKTIFSQSQGAGNVYSNFDIPRENQIADVLNEVYQYWDGNSFQTERQVTENPFIDTINLIFGTYGLFELCANTNVHPLAQLSAVGKSMIDSAIRSFAFAGIGSIASIIPNFGAAFGGISKFFGIIASIGLLVGFILFYVLPFMPFMYFFFAVAAWVKTIFEAMVAMPLWALAHLRIDSESIPGEAALQGYYLLFEIFIRPILIVFGLIASITIFAAMVKVLNEIYYLVISNLSGHDARSNTACFQTPENATDAAQAQSNQKNQELRDAYRGPIDEFFFTVVYAVFVYMIGQSSFKLVDTIPKQILRWMGIGVNSFIDEREDPAAGLVTYLVLGGSSFGERLGGSISNVGEGIKQSLAPSGTGKN